MSGATEGTSRRSPGVSALPLQLREASPGLEIWAGCQNTRVAGWAHQQVADIERNLLIEVFAVVEERYIRAFCLDPAGDLGHSGIGSGGLATIDDGSTPGARLQNVWVYAFSVIPHSQP